MAYTPLTSLSRQISSLELHSASGHFYNVAITSSLIVSGPGGGSVGGDIALIGPCTISGSNYIVLDYDQLPTSDPGEKGRLYIEPNRHLAISAG